jgi:uncharacterized surface anchored protein
MSAKLVYRTGLTLLFSMLGIFTAEAQVSSAAGSGSITGTVIDPQGAVIQGAKVEVTNELTKAPYTTKTDNTGFYRFSRLASGDYRVRFISQGFKTETKTVAVAPSTDTRLDVKLAVGEWMSSGPVVTVAEVPVIALDSEPLPTVPLVGGIAGKVVNRKGRAISGVRISVINAAGDILETITDNDGIYHLSSLAAGSYSVRLEAKGSQRETKIGVQVTPSQLTFLHSELKPSPPPGKN